MATTTRLVSVWMKFKCFTTGLMRCSSSSMSPINRKARGLPRWYTGTATSKAPKLPVLSEPMTWMSEKLPKAFSMSITTLSEAA